MRKISVYNFDVKRFIAISLLFCANLILLAHSIVPHHHHNGIVVSLQLESRYEHNNNDEHNHHHDCDHHDSHDHSKDSDSEHCLLYNLLTRFVISSKENSDTGAVDMHFTLWHALCPGQPQLVALESRRIKHRPYLLFQYTVPDITSNGLRGPPFC